MNKSNWKTYAFWIGLSEAVGLLAGLLTRNSVQIYSMMIQRPPLSPPAIVFPIVWTILYALMGISAARIRLAEPSAKQRKASNLFVAQLIVNFFWSLFFFNLQAFDFALLWLILLWVLVFLLIRATKEVDKLAYLLLIPYLAWLNFALYLNAGVVVLN